MRHALLIALLPFVLFATGCDDSAVGEGHLDLRVPEFFDANLYRGSFRVEIRVGKCKQEPWFQEAGFRERRRDEGYETYTRARESFERSVRAETRRMGPICARAYDTSVKFEGRALSVFSRVFDVRCQNISGEKIRCVGGDLELHPRFGVVRYVAVTEGSRLLGYHIWQLGTRPPQLIATFGQGVDYVPR